jgi:hypothetical protein
MKLILLKKYKKLYFKKLSDRNFWLVKGVSDLINMYNRFDITIIIDKSAKSDDPIFCHSDNSVCSGIIYIDPDRAYSADYTDKNLVTIARTHCENIKKSKILLNSKRYLDFVLGICHEVGHIKKQHGLDKNASKYSTDIEYRQMIEAEAEQEVIIKAKDMKIGDQAVLSIIEPI